MRTIASVEARTASATIGNAGSAIQARPVFHDEKGGARWVHSPIR
jgi:hypothetical protein